MGHQLDKNPGFQRGIIQCTVSKMLIPIQNAHARVFSKNVFLQISISPLQKKDILPA